MRPVARKEEERKAMIWVRSAMAPETMVVAVAAKTNWNDLIRVRVALKEPSP